MAIPFTQFLRPDGRPTDVTIERGAEVEAKAQAIIARGLRFECEVLRTGHVSLTITDDERGDLAIQLCANSEAVPAAVDRLIERFSLETATA